MYFKAPIDLEAINILGLDREVLRACIIAEMDVCNLYEQLSASTEDNKIKEILKNVLKDEKTHVGEFLSILKKIDHEQTKELFKGERIAENIYKKEQGE